MQANEDVARKLAQLTVKAGEQRAQIQDELTYMRNKHPLSKTSESTRLKPCRP